MGDVAVVRAHHGPPYYVGRCARGGVRAQRILGEVRVCWEKRGRFFGFFLDAQRDVYLFIVWREAGEGVVGSSTAACWAVGGGEDAKTVPVPVFVQYVGGEAEGAAWARKVMEGAARMGGDWRLAWPWHPAQIRAEARTTNLMRFARGWWWKWGWRGFRIGG